MRIAALLLLAFAVRGFGAAYPYATIYDTLATLTNSTPYSFAPVAVAQSPSSGRPPLVYTYSASATNAVNSPWVLPAKGGGRWLAYQTPFSWLEDIPQRTNSILTALQGLTGGTAGQLVTSTGDGTFGLSNAPVQFEFEVNSTPYTSANLRDTGVIEWTYGGGELYAWIPQGVISTNLLSTGAISYLVDRGSHTGTQAISTVSGLQSALDGKQATNANLTTLATLDGSGLTGLNGSNISTGTVADARIASTIARDSEVAAAYQPLAPNLTDLAGMTGLAGSIPYFNGSILTALGIGSSGQFLVVSGSTPTWTTVSYQPLDPGLTEIAGFSGIAGQMPYHDGSTWTPIVSTSAGRTLLSAADASAQRTALGLGTLATVNDAPSDGSEYVRKDGAWAVSSGGGGGGGTTAISNVMQRVASASWEVVIDANDLGGTWTNLIQNATVSGLFTAVVSPSPTTNNLGTTAPPFPDARSSAVRVNIAASGGLSSGLVYVFTDRIRQTTNVVQASKTNSGWGQTTLSLLTDSLVSTNLPLLLSTDPGVLERSLGTANTGIHYWTNSYQLDVFTVTNLAVAAGSYEAGTNVVITGNTISTVRAPSRMWASGTGSMASNTVSEITWVDSTIPDLEDGDSSEIRLWGLFSINNGSTAAMQVRAYLNGTLIHDSTTAGLASVANSWRPWRSSMWLFRSGSTAQFIADFNAASSSASTGVGTLASVASLATRLWGATNSAVTWGASTNVIKITATPSSSTATNIWLPPRYWIGR